MQDNKLLKVGNILGVISEFLMLPLLSFFALIAFFDPRADGGSTPLAERLSAVLICTLIIIALLALAILGIRTAGSQEKSKFNKIISILNTGFAFVIFGLFVFYVLSVLVLAF